ncbi:hypothetical protein BH24PSE2_BH24PSE2_19970 [soil metagenome]
MNRKAFGIGIAGGVIVALLGLLAVGLIVAYSGGYNVAATEDHTAFSRWLLETTMHKSVENRAQLIATPERFTPAMIAAGAEEYRAMCEHCHAGPGVDRAGWADGMLPQPPHLTEAAAEWAPEEVFWMVKHGIKMSGMPAFGADHSDATLWHIAAFVEQLPAMTPEEYAAFGDGPAHGGDNHTGGTQ